MTTPIKLVTSTTHLTPDGILGYAKGIAAVLSAVLIAAVDFLPDGTYKQWTPIAIAICGAIATIVIPNTVKPIAVVPADRQNPLDAEKVALLGVVMPPAQVDPPLPPRVPS